MMIAMHMRESKCSDFYIEIIIIDQNLSCHSIILFKEMHMRAIHFCQIISLSTAYVFVSGVSIEVS